MRTQRLTLKIAAILTLTALPLAVHADIVPVFNIDFGAAGVGYTGDNTPAHAAGLLTDAVTFFQSGNARSAVDIDPSANALFISVERGDTASAYLGGSNGFISGGSTTTAITDGTGVDVFATDLTNDGLISFNSTTTFRGPVGAMVNINNLAHGDYALFVVAHIGANRSSQAMRVSYEIQGVTLTGNVNWTTAALPGQMTTLSGSTTGSWVAGNNYARFNFTIDENTPATRTLVVASNIVLGNENSTLSAMQLVAIPPISPTGMVIVIK